MSRKRDLRMVDQLSCRLASLVLQPGASQVAIDDLRFQLQQHEQRLNPIVAQQRRLDMWEQICRSAAMAVPFGGFYFATGARHREGWRCRT